MRIQKDLRAVSTILTVLLILAAAILGGLISYMWAIAPFYATPSNGLSITNANFPLYHADYFYVTVLNPSYSSSGTNVTSISINVSNGTSLFNVTDTNPILPVFLDVGASVIIRCNFNWGAYAGENITVNVLPQSGIGATYTVQPAFVGLTTNAYLNATETVESFVMTVQNDANSAINLTLNGVSIDGTAIPDTDFSITLPTILNIGNTTVFTCFFDWQGHSNPDIVAETQEGYNSAVTEQINASALLLVDNVQFNETNQDLINITLLNSPASATPLNITKITIAYGNNTDVINGTLSNPPLPYSLNVNASVTLDCTWNWTLDSYRNMTIGVTAFTSQGFASETTTFITPADVAAQVDRTEFDLGDTGHFTVNVTNLPYSRQKINVTEIDFSNNAINISQPLLAIGGQAAFACAFNWSSFVGQNVSITVYATYDDGNKSLLLPFEANVTYFEISSASFSDFSLGNPYMNVTVSNSQFSKANANITQVSIQTENGTQTIDGTISYPQISPQYPIAAGTEQTFTCPWNWSPYSGQDVTVIVQTSDGFQASMTLKV